MEMKKINTKFSKAGAQAVPNTLKRQAFLDTLYDESFEDPYRYSSFEEAISDLSGKFKLSMDEIKYLKKKGKDGKIAFVEKIRKGQR